MSVPVLHTERDTWLNLTDHHVDVACDHRPERAGGRTEVDDRRVDAVLGF